MPLYYTIKDIKKNILNFYNKLKAKNMDISFWIIADRMDFKPLSYHSIKTDTRRIIRSMSDVSKYYLVKPEYYKNKKFVNITINIDFKMLTKLDIENLHKYSKSNIITVKFHVFPVNSNGSIDYNQVYLYNVIFLIDDLKHLAINTKNIEMLMRFITQIIKHDKNNDIYYKDIIKKINK